MSVATKMDQVETYISGQMPVDLAKSAGELLVRTWPRPGITVDHRVEQLMAPGRDYTGSPDLAPRSVVIQRERRVVAHAMLFTRTISTDAGSMTVAGLSKVCVAADQRGQHLGERVVRAAFEPVDRQILPFALFQTTNSVSPFYMSLGAVEATNKFVNSRAADPHESPWWDEIVLRYPGDRPGWPAGVIDLLGPAF